MTSRVYTNKIKSKVLANAEREIKAGTRKEVSLWKDVTGVWHAAHGKRNVPDYAVEVEHVK